MNETTDKSNTSNPVLDPETQYRRANELCIKGCKESRGWTLLFVILSRMGNVNASFLK